ncbi:MAG: hypothetical protein E7432_04540 [Ruminococcaceae bacterium]|nr:hypothetical protein [Oscillospiraceae bacterium]
MDYILSDSYKHSYFMLPKFIFNFDLTPVSIMLYALLYSRSFISQSNGWTDDNGNVYVVLTIEEAAAVFRCSTRTVIRSLNELEKYDLIARRHTADGPANHIFVKHPWIAVEAVGNKEELEMLLVQANENRADGPIRNIVGSVVDNKVKISQ